MKHFESGQTLHHPRILIQLFKHFPTRQPSSRALQIISPQEAARFSRSLNLVRPNRHGLVQHAGPQRSRHRVVGEQVRVLDGRGCGAGFGRTLVPRRGYECLFGRHCYCCYGCCSVWLQLGCLRFERDLLMAEAVFEVGRAGLAERS